MLTRLELERWRSASGWCVALSGGLDSSVLLYLLHAYLQQQSGPPLRAVHIQHGLQAAALAWPQHCLRLCDRLGVPLEILEVQVAATASVEQAARQARYQAFADNLQPGEVLMLGQHADDQAETLLLRLLRGAGVRGLQAMPLQRALGQGQLARPLLQIPRQQLLDYALARQLDWVEDPTNQQDDYDRNYLRNQVMPLLKQRWPGTLAVFSRTCRQMQRSAALLDELAGQDLQQAACRPQPDWLQLPTLQLQELRKLSRERQINLLRYWLGDKTLLPDERHWAGWDSLCRAGTDAQPQWQLDNGVLVRSGQQLYWLATDWLEQPVAPELTISTAGNYLLPGNGVLEIQGPLAQELEVCYRQGGEQMQLAGRGRRDLKRLLQEAQVPWFVRQRLPLLFHKQQLVAVANYPRLSAIKLPQIRWRLTA